MPGSLFATSDLHSSFSENRRIIDEMRPESSDDWLIVAGDVAQLHQMLANLHSEDIQLAQIPEVQLQRLNASGRSIWPERWRFNWLYLRSQNSLGT